jgi:hypothetical protein
MAEYAVAKMEKRAGLNIGRIALHAFQQSQHLTLRELQDSAGMNHVDEN